jgi:hypothetical protein
MSKNNNRKPSFRDGVREFAEEFFGREFSRLKPRQHHEAMLRYYLQEVYSNTVEPLSEVDIDEGFCDGTDAGADFFRKDGERVVIIQAKYRGDGQATEILTDLSHFQDVLRRLHPSLGRAWRKNTKLEEAAADIDFDADTFHLEYITLGRLHDTARNVFNEGIKEIESIPDLPARANIVYYDESGLNEQLRIALSQAGGIPDSIDLYFAEGSGHSPAAIELATPHRTLLGAVTGTSLANLYNAKKEQLFTLNIRSYLGRTKTNKEILATLKREPEEFLNYNNGVAFICKTFEWDPSSRKLRMEKPQIINGAQTVRCLVAVGKSLDKKVLVALKITENGEFYQAENEKFYNSVIRYSNTQNVIKDIDFRSNDPVQVDLQRRFGELKFLGKPVYYQRKRTDKKPGGSPYVIQISDLCKNLYSFFWNPTDFASKSTFLFDDNPGQGYTKLFGDGKEVFSTFSKERFQLYAGAWFMCALTSEWRSVARKAYLTEGKHLEAAALERTYFLYSAIRLLLEKKYPGEKWEDTVRRYAKSEWADDGSSKKYLALQELYELGEGAVSACYKDAASSSSFNHRNWTRAPESFNKIGSYIEKIVPVRFIPDA